MVSFKIHMYVEVFKYNFYYDFAEFTSRYLNRKKSDDGAEMSFKVIQHKVLGQRKSNSATSVLLTLCTFTVTLFIAAI